MGWAKYTEDNNDARDENKQNHIENQRAALKLAIIRTEGGYHYLFENSKVAICRTRKKIYICPKVQLTAYITDKLKRNGWILKHHRWNFESPKWRNVLSVETYDFAKAIIEGID